MLLAVWHPGGAPRGFEAARPNGAPGGGRFEVTHGWLWAEAPARFAREEGGAVGWLHASTPSGPGEHGAGPQLRLTAGGLDVTSGPLPQHPLYYYRAPDDSLFAVCSHL